MSPNVERLQNRQDQLSRELMVNTIVNEVTRVMLSAPTLAESLNSYMLGVAEVSGIRRIAFFSVDALNFRLRPVQAKGVDEAALQQLSLPLGFLAGEYPDSIFLNRHIIVDPIDPADPFTALGVHSYAVMPIVSRVTSNCWRIRKCGKTECPCYEGHNPYCWSVSGAALDTGATTEDERRVACVNCSQFKCEGVVWLGFSTPTEKVRADHIANLTTLNRHLGMVIETFNMYGKLEMANRRLGDNNEILSTLNAELNRAHQRINAELDHARSIQKGLMPERFPEGWARDVAARYLPAGKVGGDYYDCFPIGENQLGLVVADVSGHGIAAALLMSMFKVLLKTHSPVLRDPLQVLEHINRTFLNEIKGTSYVTVFFAILDLPTRRLTYCNAGHPPQIICQPNGECQELKASGLFVGILDDMMLEQKEVVLPPQARLVFYTDGLIEGRNDKKEIWGFERLQPLVAAGSGLKSMELIDHIMETFNTFCGNQEIADDLTLLVIDL